MRLNTLKPPAGSKSNRKRRGRGIGSTLGKTAGRGHKGQHSRSGGYHKVGFEGGQMPLQRRLPKIGFRSRVAASSAEVRLYHLNGIDADVIDLEVLKANKIIGPRVKKAKVIRTGTLNGAVKLKGINVTPGAKEAIEAAGGSVE